MVEKPAERLLLRGPTALSDAELLAVLIRNGDGAALTTAQALLQAQDGVLGLAASAEVSALRERGLEPPEIAAVVAAVEFSRRLARGRVPDREPLSHPAAIATYLSLRYGREDQEVVGALYLDVHNRLVAEAELFRGTLRRASVEPRQILKRGLFERAAGIVLFHTHPSGDPIPSTEDIVFTRRLAEAGEVLGIRLVDHLVLGHGGQFTSLRRRGVLSARWPPAAPLPRRKAKPKYRHPKTGETWAGRGNMARWLRREIENGAKKEDFLIRDPETDLSPQINAR